MAEIVNKNPVNDPTQKGVHTRSTFDLGQSLANTERFGEITPRFALEVTAGDHLPYRFSHNLRTYTFKAPHMGTIRRNEDAFFVPAECILPLNWDKVFTNPLLGEDVDASRVGCTVVGFTKYVASVFDAISSPLSNQLSLASDEEDETYTHVAFEYVLKFLLGLEMFYSNGSLLSTLGAHLSSLVKLNGNSVDKAIDLFFTGLPSTVKYFTVSEGLNQFYVNLSGSDLGLSNVLSLRQFLEIARDGYASWHIAGINYATAKSKSDLISFLEDFIEPSIIYGGVDDEGLDLSLARFAAYQIVCAHFYTNDKIDYVYDANLYRQNVLDALYLYQDYRLDESFYCPMVFDLNGSRFEYDSLSAAYFYAVCDDLSLMSDLVPVAIDAAFDYFRLLFGYNRSLRFVDYFTGSKSRPLAVGDVNVGVVSNQVNVVDVTRNIQRQRFLNAVNRVGRRISEYVKGIFGVSQAPDYHNPFFLSHTSDELGAQEIENTGSEQREPNSVTSIMRSASSRYQFEFDGDRVGILIGVVYYDIERYYFNGIEKLMTHVDRYDMFNPFMQFTGDQPVDGSELDVRYGGLTFGYQMRYSEYKQRYNQCSGGFVEFLPGWIFKANETEDNNRGIWNTNISPSFIRSKPSELDPFYERLTGYSLASYFHFIVINDNACEGSRPMAYAPSIL